MSVLQKFNGKEVIKQANIINNAVYSLTLNEKRIVCLLMNEIACNRHYKDEDCVYPIKINHLLYKNILRHDKARNISRDITKAATGLNTKEVIFYVSDDDKDEEERALDALTWTVQRSHRPKQNETILYLNPKLVHLLEKTASNYHFLIITDIGELEKMASFSIYQMLIQWINQGSLSRTVSKLVSNLGISTRYAESFNDFRKRYLRPALEEINSKTCINISVKEIKRAGEKRVHRLDFKIEWKPIEFYLERHTHKTLEQAKITYKEVRERERLPWLPQLENIITFKEELEIEGYLFDDYFFANYHDAEIRAKEFIENTSIPELYRSDTDREVRNEEEQQNTGEWIEAERA